MFQTVSFKLTEVQHKKIASAKNNGISVILRLNIGQKLAGGTPLLLTNILLANILVYSLMYAIPHSQSF